MPVYRRNALRFSALRGWSPGAPCIGRKRRASSRRPQEGRAMKFGIFYELQLPRPWLPGGELQLYQNALDQVELADRLGYDYAWEVEHHFLEEYSHSPAPEVFLAAASQPHRQDPARSRHRPDPAAVQSPRSRG